MSNDNRKRPTRFGTRGQQGVATLLVTLMVLIILTVIVLSSSNVALFEQKTSTNENREKLAEQAAEYALNVAGEFLKVNVSKVSTTATGGWLNAGSLHWKSCAGFTDAAYAAASAVDKLHPCYAVESNEARRLQLYYYTDDGSPHTGGADAGLNISTYDSLVSNAGIDLPTTGTGGNTKYPTTATVQAVMCRLETLPAPAVPTCKLSPAAGRRIAITLISKGNLTNENASSTVRETWGTLSSASFSSSTPLVAAGTINIVGTFTLVDAPNAGGPGAYGSIWTPADAGGNGSWQTCHAEDYLGSYAESQLMTNPGCADIHANPKCLCDGDPVPENGPNAPVMSKGNANDGPDILDKDGGNGELPDITFFPGASDISSAAQIAATRMDYRACTAAGTPYADCTAALVNKCSPSHPYCLTDDNMFEWTFGIDVTGGDTTVVQTNCTVPSTFDPSNSNPGDCELKALSDLNFQPIANCSGLNAASSGLYYVTGTCTLPNVAQIGTKDKPVILVVDNDITVGHTDLFYGMLFVRSPNTATHLGDTATISGNASGKWFGSILVEGSADHLNGTMDLIYMDTSAGSPDDPLPDSTRFARLPGSWLDNRTTF